MRKITSSAMRAFDRAVGFCLDNTAVIVDNNDGCVYLSLFGKLIARRNLTTNVVEVRTCGWDTVTTRDRLNGIAGVSVYRRRGTLYLNGKPWENHAVWTAIAP